MNMKKIIHFIVLSLISLASAQILSAQLVNSLYFLENAPLRHQFNPAFQPLQNFYFGIPVASTTQLSFGNNSLTLKDLIYNDRDGSTITFLHPYGSKEKFLSAIKNTASITADFQIDLLNFGFRSRSSYWSFSIAQKLDANIGFPKDFFNFLLLGTTLEESSNNFNFKSLCFGLNAYTEAALGYSKILNEKWAFGAKFKLLLGNANITLSNEYINLKADINEWELKGKGLINATVPGKLVIDQGKKISYSQPTNSEDWIKPSGTGIGVDLGFTFKPINNFILSGALTNLGSINWKTNPVNMLYNFNYKFNGFSNFNISDFNNFLSDSLALNILNTLGDSLKTSTDNLSYKTGTIPKLNIAVEYSVFNNKLGFGLLSRTAVPQRKVVTELTALVNMRPVQWFNLSLSYSVLNGRMNNIGAGLGLQTGFVHWFLAADFIPLLYVPLPINSLATDFPDFAAYVPYNTKGLNLAFGANLVIGKKK